MPSVHHKSDESKGIYKNLAHVLKSKKAEKFHACWSSCILLGTNKH
jgi:hypothetical protein